MWPVSVTRSPLGAGGISPSVDTRPSVRSRRGWTFGWFLCLAITGLRKRVRGHSSGFSKDRVPEPRGACPGRIRASGGVRRGLDCGSLGRPAPPAHAPRPRRGLRSPRGPSAPCLVDRGFQRQASPSRAVECVCISLLASGSGFFTSEADTGNRLGSVGGRGRHNSSRGDPVDGAAFLAPRWGSRGPRPCVRLPACGHVPWDVTCSPPPSKPVNGSSFSFVLQECRVRCSS